MRSVREPSVAASASPRPTSAVASVSAAGSPRATSKAKLGPDSTAWLARGIVSHSTSPRSLPVACSRPLAHSRTGLRAGRCCASAPATERTCWAGATISTASCRATRPRSAVALTPAWSVTPGRNAEFMWLALISATTSGSRAHRHTWRPARHRVCASAVPHAPPPSTPRLENVPENVMSHAPCAKGRRCRRLPSKHRLRTNAQGVDAGAAEQQGANAIVLGGRLPYFEPLLDAFGRTDERRLVNERVRHCGGGLLLAPREEGVLDLPGRCLKAQALDVIVVKILGARTHAANVERHFRLERVAARLQILAHGDAHKGRDVEFCQRLAPTRSGHSREHRLGDEARPLRAHVDGLHAVRQLAGHTQSGRRKRGRIDLEAGVGMHGALERLAEARGIRPRIGDRVVLALVRERRLAREHLADDLDVLARAHQRLAVGHAVPAFDHLWPRRANP